MWLFGGYGYTDLLMRTLSTLLLSGKWNNIVLFFKSIWPLSCSIVIFSFILKVLLGSP